MPPPCPDIRLVAPALDSAGLVALGEFEENVHLVGLEPIRTIATFPTVLSFGGDRLALCSSGGSLVVVAAAWERHGVCGYEPLSGEQLWQRRDLKRAGAVTPAGDGSLAAIALDQRAMQVVDAATGDQIATIRDAHRLWQSRHRDIAAVASHRQLGLVETLSWGRLWTAHIGGFALLDVAFAVDGLVASDTGKVGYIYAFGLDGREAWRHRLPDEMLCWAVGWDDRSDEWVGVAHHVNRLTPDLLMRWGRDGRQISATELAPVAAVAFLPGGRTLITESHVVDTQTGFASPLCPGAFA